MAILNTASSITDYLKGKGFTSPVGDKYPYFDVRKKAYETLGLQNQLGDYIGSAEQNPALLSALSAAEKNVGVSITPTNLFDIIGAGKQPAANPYTDIYQSAQPTQQPAPIGGTTSSGVSGATVDSGATADEMPSWLSSLAQQAGTSNIPSADELSQMALEQFTGSQGYKFAQEEVGASKAQIQLNAQRETESFIKNIASRGLIFSGAKSEGISQIEVDKMSDLLGVDRSFAKLIAEGLQTSSQEIVKQAKKGSEDAISALDKLGYVLTPDGTLVQKPSETRAVSAEERAVAAGERADVATQLSIMSADRAERQMEATQARYESTEARLLANQSGVLTSAEDIAKVQAYTQYVMAGTDPTGNKFALNNVPEKYRGNVAVQTLAYQATAAAPSNLTDEEFRIIARSYQSEGISYEQALAEMNADSGILNKDRGALILGEILKSKSTFVSPGSQYKSVEPLGTQLKALWELIKKK